MAANAAVFLEVKDSFYLFLRKRSDEYPSLGNYILSITYSFKQKWCSTKEMTILAYNSVV